MKNISMPKNTSLIMLFFYTISFVLFSACDRHEKTDLTGSITGNFQFQDIIGNAYPYPGGPYQIIATCGNKAYYAEPDHNGNFLFSELPMGGYSFTLTCNAEELITVDNCSFLGGTIPSSLNFCYALQPDILSIDYHFEIENDSLWIVGHVEPAGTSPVACNIIRLFYNFSPDDSKLYSMDVPFDPLTNTIRHCIFRDSFCYIESGVMIRSFIYRKYIVQSACFTNYIALQGYFVNYYGNTKNTAETAGDSTSIYTFIIP